MIFATVGTQLPFDRLITALDDWQAKDNKINVLAQIGRAGVAPRYCDFLREVDPSHFEKIIANCKVIVSHCGIGSVFTALAAQKPIIVMPRRAALGEHRNDHQVATAQRLRQIPGISVVDDSRSLITCLDRLEDVPELSRAFSPFASDALLGAVQQFVRQG